MKILPLILFMLAMDAFESVAAVNIVENGDFEIVAGPDYPPWQFSDGFIGVVNEPWLAASGGNCVFIGGVNGGHMWQDLSTIAGQTYQFSFYERGDDPTQSERVSLLNVWWGSQVVASYTEDNIGFGWNYHAFDVVATTSTTRINFEQSSYLLGSFGFPGIDAVSVFAVPEPPTASLFLIILVTYLAMRSLRLTDMRNTPQRAVTLNHSG